MASHKSGYVAEVAGFDFVVQTNFEAGFPRFSKGARDLVIPDVRRGTSNPRLEDEAAGYAVNINMKETRFAQVVFWTALRVGVIDEQMKFPICVQPAIATRPLVVSTS